MRKYSIIALTALIVLPSVYSHLDAKIEYHKKSEVVLARGGGGRGGRTRNEGEARRASRELQRTPSLSRARARNVGAAYDAATAPYYPPAPYYPVTPPTNNSDSDGSSQGQ